METPTLFCFILMYLGFICTITATTTCSVSSVYERLFINSMASETPSLKKNDVLQMECVTFCHRRYGVDCKTVFYDTQNKSCSIYNSSFTCVTPRHQSSSTGFVQVRNPPRPMDECYLWPPTEGVYPLNVSKLLPAVNGYFDSDGWLVMQRRMNGSENFNRTWIEYEDGFGDLQNEFWLGNKYVHLLTNQKQYEVKFSVLDSNGTRGTIHFEHFSISDAADKYRLTLVGRTTSNTTDFMSYHRGQPFSTEDQDNDNFVTKHCAQSFGCGWWFVRCAFGPLNAKYGVYGIYTNWPFFTRRLKQTEIKIRPRRL
ncbi:ryncolin-4-like [Gigantopelta aegis]|uniref:ryncolin-4-like n=1 Tax=Gigantopelta aegis TaxID=1735272 RepID=UPI001B88E4CA|nr:ryncolin-4-like [Gigantopelta aegis]